ncbi:MAG: hypothetical protein HC836_45135 [Richelia sp. RM2_1_2]|nr:hypothetical protein [Richelia sp. RM2_1_2]
MKKIIQYIPVFKHDHTDHNYAYANKEDAFNASKLYQTGLSTYPYQKDQVVGVIEREIWVNE